MAGDVVKFEQSAPAPRRSFDEIMRMAETIAKSRLFGVTQVDQVVALMLMAEAEGRHVASAMQDYSVIQGKPSLKAEAMLARFQQAQGQLSGALSRLLAVSENYPQLKADESFQHLQARITALEEGIADRRELYNSSVNLNNVRVQQFPDLLVARAFSFGTAQLLEFAEEQKRDVDVKALFG